MCGQGRSPGPQHSQGPTRGRAAPLAALRQRGQRGSRHRPALPPPRAATAPRRRRAADDRTAAVGLAAAGRSLQGAQGPGPRAGSPTPPLPPTPYPTRAGCRCVERQTPRCATTTKTRPAPRTGPGAAAPASRRAPLSPASAACELPRGARHILFLHAPPRHRTPISTPHARAHAARPRRHRTEQISKVQL